MFFFEGQGYTWHFFSAKIAFNCKYQLRVTCHINANSTINSVLTKQIGEAILSGKSHACFIASSGMLIKATIKMIKKITLLLIGLIMAMGVFANSKTLMMATTTSTDNTGLLDYLAKKFLQDTGIQLRWVSVGSGKALALGENCDVDILLVHSPKEEEQFMKKGYGDTRTKVMYNDFVLVGPKDDPIKTQGLPIDKSFETIFKTKTLFVSRNDDSGTDKKEKALWRRINIAIPEQAKWYIRSGQGMMAIINMAAEISAYTLTDRATFIKFVATHKDSPLKILSQIEPVLRNQYSIIPISATQCRNTKIDFANTFKHWLISEQAQKFIAQFKLLNQTLYTPNATES